MSVLTAGQHIRSFVLADQIGRTNMGEVWRAFDSAGETVAVKTIALDFRSDASFAARFQREAEEQRGLRHPSIVPIYDFFEEQDGLFLVMRYIPGGSLQDLIEREGRLSVSRALEISLQVLAALDHAHQRGLIHRDVKPSNILLENNCAYLSDFGIALPIGKARLTTGFSVMGTPEYMSPEQIQNPLGVDHLADVYGFGCVLYEMLSGVPPFLGDPEAGEFDVQRKHVHETPVPLRERNSSVPVRLERIVMTSLAKAPEDRFAGCGSFGKALESVIPELDVPLPQANTDSPLAIPAAKRRVRLSAALNISLALAGIGLPFFSLHRDFFVPLFLVGWIGFIFVQMRVLYIAWQSIRDGNRRATAAAAVGRLFIPIFGTYWGSQAYPGFASDYNRFVAERGFGCPRQPVWFYWFFYLFQFIAVPVLVFVNQKVAGYAFWIEFCALGPAMIAFLCSAVNRLADARPETFEILSATPHIQVLG